MKTLGQYGTISDKDIERLRETLTRLSDLLRDDAGHRIIHGDIRMDHALSDADGWTVDPVVRATTITVKVTFLGHIQ